MMVHVYVVCMQSTQTSGRSKIKLNTKQNVDYRQLYIALAVYAPIMLHWNANKFVLGIIMFPHCKLPCAFCLLHMH